MNFPQRTPLQQRIAEIDASIQELRLERSLWAQLEESAGRGAVAICSRDILTAKNAVKFEVLGLVTSVLSDGNHYVYGGLQTRKLFDEVVQKIAKQRTLLAEANARRTKLGLLELDPGTPLTNGTSELPYTTFRSHLNRFREEGRIFYDQNTKRWAATPENPATQIPAYPPRDERDVS